jgi:hypothetical protein
MEIDFGRSVPLYPDQTPQKGEGEVDFSQSRPLPQQKGPEASWGKTIGSGLQQAAIAPLGLAGDMQQLISATPQMGTAAATWIRDKVGLPFSDEQKAAMNANAQKASGFLGALPDYNIASLASQALGGPKIKAPSSKEIADAVDPYAQRALGVGPNYEPATLPERAAKAGLGMAGVGALGPIRGAGVRAFSGLTGGGASEVAGEQTKGTAWELPARLAGAVAGGAAGQWAASGARDIAKGVAMPDRSAKETMGNALKNYDVEQAPLAQTMARSPNLKESADGMSARMREFTENLLGIKGNAPQFMERMEALGAAERKRVYNLARSMPAAQAIDDKTLNAIRNRGIFKEAEAAAMKNAADVPQWGIVAPGAGRAGNLSYYDQVKKELDSIIEQAARTGDTTRKAAAETARADMLRVLDRRIPQYSDARGIARDTFRAETAPQAGDRFFTLSDQYGVHEFKKAFSTFTPEQKQGFALGFMGRLEQELATKNPTNIANRFLKDKQFQEKMQFALGKQWADSVRGKVLSENLIQQADRLRAQVSSSAALQKVQHPYRGKVAAGAIAGAIGSAGFELQAIAQTLGMLGISPTMAVGVLGASGAALGKSFVMTKVEQRVANRMVDLMKRNDPRLYNEINRLLDRHPEVYNKILAPLVIMQQAQPQEGAQPQASGGRVGRAAGGRTMRLSDRLLMAVERARRETQAETKPMLNAPDETVVKALEMAKQHI